MKFERTAAALELVCVCYSSRDGMKKYAVAYEQAPGNWAAYVPGLPACITTGSTLAQTSRNIREAMELHLGAMAEVGEEIPDPSAKVGLVELQFVEEGR